MKNVIETLKYIAKHGVYWFNATNAGFWILILCLARSCYNDSVGFTQADIREFMKHYDEVTRKDVR